MTKRVMALAAGLGLAVSVAAFAVAQGVTVMGKVTAVNGDAVTIEVEKGKGASLKAGDSVEVMVKEGKKAPKAGADALQGC